VLRGRPRRIEIVLPVAGRAVKNPACCKKADTYLLENRTIPERKQQPYELGLMSRELTQVWLNG
jgi:hypothetical protein